MLSINDLSFSFPGQEKTVLTNISFSIKQGEYLAILGHNGSGKTSLLRLLAALYAPSKGNIVLDGMDLSLPENHAMLRRKFALIFQDPQAGIVAETVATDAAFALEQFCIPQSQMRDIITTQLTQVGLAEKLDRASDNLSLGEIQRLAIAGALTQIAVTGQAAYIAFDEATAMLGPQMRATILDLIDNLHSRGLSIINVTHHIDEAARAQRIIVLDKGRLIYDGNSKDFFSLARPLPLALEYGFTLPTKDYTYYLDENGKAKKNLSLPFLLQQQLTHRVSQQQNKILLRLHNVEFTYKGTAKPSISNISFEICAGRLYSLIGASGSGKSTVLQVISALLRAQKGDIVYFFDDEEICINSLIKIKAKQLKKIRMHVPLAVQRPESALFAGYAADDVAFGPMNQGHSAREILKRVRTAMEDMGLGFAEFADRAPRKLSGGEQRRLALAGIFAMQSELVLLDEPSSGLDASSTDLVLKHIQDYVARGGTVLMTTHSMEEALLADEILVLRDGLLVAKGNSATIFGKDYDATWGLERPNKLHSGVTQ